MKKHVEQVNGLDLKCYIVEFKTTRNNIEYQKGDKISKGELLHSTPRTSLMNFFSLCQLYKKSNLAQQFF